MFVIALTSIVNCCYGMDKEKYRDERIKYKKARFCLKFFRSTSFGFSIERDSGSKEYVVRYGFSGVGNVNITSKSQLELRDIKNNHISCKKFIKKYIAELVEECED